MLKILDRYLIREILVPLALALVVFTFILLIPPILREGESLIAKGVPLGIVAHAVLTLLPQALSLTVPMALLVGILVGLGRLSTDREFVALQACGVSLFRLLRPIVLIAVLATAATAYETIVALPDANQTFREITFGVVADRIESNVKPRVFFEDFPNRVIYVRDLPAAGGWRDVFLADATRADQTSVYLAREGRIVVDRTERSVVLQLSNGTRHTTYANKPDEYEGTAFASVTLSLEPETVFPRPPAKGVPEMTIAELRAKVSAAGARGETAYAELFMIQQKLSLAFACPVLALIGLSLGATNRKDGKLASFVLGFVVIFIYYVLLWGARGLALGGRLPPSWAPWIPNIVLGVAGIVMTIRRADSADRSIRISVPLFWPRSTASHGQSGPGAAIPSRRVVVVVRVPHVHLPRPKLLDLYIARQYLRIFFLGIASLLGIFYISTFMDFADKLFRGTATTSMLLWYFYFATPQFVYYIIPMSGLIATLVTIGLMTKNSELVVMKACGVSLYRSATPLLLFAALASGVLFALEEKVLAYSNGEMKRLDHLIRGYPAQTFGLLNRRWIVSSAGDIYHYEFFDPRVNRFTRFMAYRLAPRAWRLESLAYAREAQAAGARPGAGSTYTWRASQGWTRNFAAAAGGSGAKASVTYAAFTANDWPLEAPAYFKTEEVEGDRMTYGQLKSYIRQLQTSGFNAVPQLVELQRKVAFPLVTLVMTLLAVPFAVTTGRRGALYGIGVGIVLAIVYWLALSIFGAMGAGGLIPPTLAAWAPNVLFGAAAVYLILTVRT